MQTGPDRMTHPKLGCDVIAATDLSERHKAAWAAMRAATEAFRSPLLSLEFTEAVAQVRDDVYVAVYHRGSEIIGFLPHHRRPNGVARPAGAPLADYCAFVSMPNPAVTQADLFDLAEILEYRATGMIDPFGVFETSQAETLETFGFDLSDTAGPVNINKKLSKNINRLRRHIDADIGPVRLITDDRNPDHFRQMIALKRHQTEESGLHDFLGTPWIAQLIDNLFAQKDGPLRGRMVTLMGGDTPLVFHFGPWLDDRAHPWISSFDPAYRAYSPGQIFLTDLPQVLKAEGMLYYDLAIGQSHYKRAFCNHEGTVLQTHLFGSVAKAAKRAHAYCEFNRATHGWARSIAQPMRRLSRRLDHIASIEIDTQARAQGCLSLVLNLSKRIRPHDHA